MKENNGNVSLRNDQLYQLINAMTMKFVNRNLLFFYVYVSDITFFKICAFITSRFSCIILYLHKITYLFKFCRLLNFFYNLYIYRNYLDILRKSFILSGGNYIMSMILGILSCANSSFNNAFKFSI